MKISKAIVKGKEAAGKLEERISGSTVKSCCKDKPVFVIISKIYGIADKILNMGIPDKLIKYGYDVIPFYELPERSIKKDYADIYWPFAQRILSSAYDVKENENYYPLILTHHGCGPDSVILHYFKEIIVTNIPEYRS